MSGQGREEKGLFPKGMILACVILFLLGIGCVGMNLAAGPSEEKNPMGQIADYRKKEEKKKNYFLLSFHLKKSSYPIRGFFLLSSKQCISIFIFLNCGITDAAPPFKPHILAACVGVINPWCLFQRCVNHLP